MPIALISGGNDDLADPKDVAWLAANLPADKLVFQHQEATYAHLDYTWGEDAHTLIYPDILKLLKQYNA